MVYGTHNYSYWGESKPTNITGGPHILHILPSHRKRVGLNATGRHGMTGQTPCPKYVPRYQQKPAGYAMGPVGPEMLR